MPRAKEWAGTLTRGDGNDAPGLIFPAVLADIDLELPDAGISVTGSV